MSQRSRLILRTLINRYDPKEQEALLKFLPSKERQALLDQDVPIKDIRPLLFQNQQTLERMHYSWLKPILKQLPDQLLPLLINSLSSHQMAGFKSRTMPVMHLAHPVKMYLQSQLFKFLDIENIKPLEFLPETELSPLAAYSKKDLMQLSDYLGLYDLASEVRQIVNKTYLKNIYTCLSPKQFHYLKTCLHQKEKLVTPALGIDPSTPDCAKLKQLVHRRGLVRLGKALCGQHKDFVWYIAHTLDTGRGQIIFDQYKPEIIPSITSFLQLQVINVMNFLKSE